MQKYKNDFISRKADESLNAKMILNPRLDGVFKTIFIKSRRSLQDFLEAAIGKKIDEVCITSSESPLDIIDDRQTEFDINCIVDGHTRAEIEIQSFNRDYDYGDRAQVYASRLLSSSLSRGNRWSEVPDVYQISLLDFVYEKENGQAVNRYLLRHVDYPKVNSMLKSKINMIFVELAKLKKMGKKDIINLTRLEKWALFFKIADRPEKADELELLKMEDGIMEASRTLNEISTDRDMWAYQIREEILAIDRNSAFAAARERGLAEGLAEGLEKGKCEGKEETARKLKQNNIPIDIIEKCTGLSRDKIESL